MKFVFVNESENIFERLVDENVKIDKSNKEKLKFISKKLYNNYIGYFQFRNDESLIKLIVLPKIIKRQNFSRENLLTHFFEYFNCFYKLKQKYNIPTESIDGNILDFSFKHTRDNLNSMNMNYYINYKYIDSIEILLRFFKKHSNILNSKSSYVSQGIKHHLDVRKNIIEINKSRIHQYKKNSINSSEYANIASKVILNFISFILPNLEEDELIRTKSYTLSSLLKKKFKIDSSFSLTHLLNNRVKKLFMKTSELQEVYNALIILSGYEKYLVDEDMSNSDSIYHINDLIAVFFRPENLFEWIVYDRLPELFETNFDEIKKDKRADGTSFSYHIIKNGEIRIEKFSNPDFLINKEGGTLLLDAKWKLFDESAKDEDVFKLERDYKVRADDSIKNYLIYPLPVCSEEDKIENIFKVEYSSFEFKTIQIKII